MVTGSFTQVYFHVHFDFICAYTLPDLTLFEPAVSHSEATTAWQNWGIQDVTEPALQIGQPPVICTPNRTMFAKYTPRRHRLQTSDRPAAEPSPPKVSVKGL